MPRKGKKSKSKSRSAKEDAEADDAYLRREQERDAELLAASLYDAELSQHHQDEACARAAYLRRQLEQSEGQSDSRSQARGRTRRGRGEERHMKISDADIYGGLHISGAESDDVSSPSRSRRSDTSSPIGRMLNAVGFKSTVGSPPPSAGYIQVAVTGSDSESDAGGSRRIGRVGRGPRSAFSVTGKGWREDMDESELEAIEATAIGASAGEESAPLTSESESEAGRRSYGGHGGGLPPGQRRMQGQRYVRGLYAAPKGIKSCLSAPFSPDARVHSRPRTQGDKERRRKRKGSRGKVSFATSSDSDAAALSSGPPSEAEPDEREKEKLRLRWSPSLDRIERQYTDQRRTHGHSSGSDSSSSDDGSDSNSDSDHNRGAPVAVAPAPRSPSPRYGGGSDSPEVELQPMSSPESPEEDNDGTLADASSGGETSDMSEGANGEVRPLARSKAEVERSQPKRKHKSKSKGKGKGKNRGKSKEKRGHKDFVVRRLKPEEKELLYRTRPDLQISTDWAQRYYSNPSIADDDDEEGDMSWIESGESGNRLCGPNAFGVSLQCSGFLAMALLFVLVTLLLCLLKWLVGDDGDQYANMMGPLEQRGRGGAGNFVNSHGIHVGGNNGNGAHLRGGLNGHGRSRDDYFR